MAAEIIELQNQDNPQGGPPEQDWSDSFAKDVIKQDFAEAESYLTQNHYQRWNNADRIYLAWTEQKYWEGTKVPRATPSVWLAFELIESLLPVHMATIFGDDPWSEAIPMPGTSPEGARISRDYILSQFEETKGREAVRRAKKSALIYGNGILEAGWESFTRKRKRYIPSWKPVQKQVVVPMLGPRLVNTGQFKRSVREKEFEEKVNRPFLRYVPLRDFYVDPNCQSPDIQDARFVIKRCYMPVDELDALRDVEGFSIPSWSDLIELSHQKSVSQGDANKTTSAAYRGESWQPSIDKTHDPAGRNVEVLNYWTKERCVWQLGRNDYSHIAWNDENSYRNSIGDQVIPFFDEFYTDVLDRFYALGLTDVTEWDQRVIVSLLGGRLDELSLNLNPPRNKRRGGYLPPYATRIRPGVTYEVDNPKDDLIVQPVSNVTQQSFVEVQAAEIRAQKTTGETDLAVLGTPATAGNAAARTATGVNTQAAASGRRTIYGVENSEANVLEPILNFFAGMDRDFLDPNEMIYFLGPNNQTMQADPLDIMNSVVKFKMRSGSRARAKAALQQMMPLMLQTFLNPEWLNMLAQQQKKVVDIMEFSNMVQDAADYKPRGALFRDMTQQEMQAMQPQPDPTKTMMQTERLQAQAQNQDAKSQSDLLKEIVHAELEDRRVTRNLLSPTGVGKI